VAVQIVLRFPRHRGYSVDSKTHLLRFRDYNKQDAGNVGSRLREFMQQQLAHVMIRLDVLYLVGNIFALNKVSKAASDLATSPLQTHSDTKTRSGPHDYLCPGRVHKESVHARGTGSMILSLEFIDSLFNPGLIT